MNVVVVGAGKMGLPLACQIADRGARVTACDVNPFLVGEINAGRCPIDEPGVSEILARAVAGGRLSASTDTAAAAADADVVIVIVPALLTPDLDIDSSILESVARSLAPSLRTGAMVVFETTMPVGGTRRRLLPLLESTGREAGRDFDLVFSPERVKSQRVMQHLTLNAKVVGGVTPEAAARAEEFYRTYLGAPVHNVGTLEAAEMVKLAGMVYRDVNIALANELAGYAEEVGIDLNSLLPAVNSDGEAALLQPGIGVGGHCTPVYPYFLIRDAERRGLPMTLPLRSRRINDGQAAHALDLLENAWGGLEARTVKILGLAFRPQVKEHTCSTAFLLREELTRRGARVVLCDPLYLDDEIRAHGFTPAGLDEPCDALVLNTAHTAFLDLDFGRLARQGVTAVVDGRDALRPDDVRAAGITYVGIGRPAPAGSKPAPLPIAKPLLADDEAEAAAAVVRSGWPLQGPQVAAFEAEFAAFTGAPHACAVSSGTAGLHLALLAAGVRPGDEVVTVSHSFIATANSVRHCGAEPVFVDIDPRTYNIDPLLVEAAITPRTAAILAVHQMGMPCDLASLTEIARRHGVPLVEDAACAAGSEILVDGRWERIGKPHGDLAVFSFHPRKILTTGDGGMVVTGSPELDRTVRLLRQQGTMDGVGFPVVGFNYRLTDVQAAVGRRQLERLPDLVGERRRLAAGYERLLRDLDGLDTPYEPAWARSNWQTYCVRLPDTVEQSDVIRHLADQGVSSRPGIMNAHTQPAYEDLRGSFKLTESEAAERHGLCLPMYPGMSDAEVARVVSALAGALASGRG